MPIYKEERHCTEPHCENEAVVAAQCFIQCHLANGEQWMQPMRTFEWLCNDHRLSLPRPTQYEYYQTLSLEDADAIIRGEKENPIVELPRQW